MSKYLDKEKHLFKFVPFNTNTLKNLINGELWFGKPINQNDPFEGEFKIEGFTKELTKTEKFEILKNISKDKTRKPIDLSTYMEKEDFNDMFFLEEYKKFIREIIIEKYGYC